MYNSFDKIQFKINFRIHVTVNGLHKEGSSTLDFII